MMKSLKRIPPGPGQESVWDYPRPPRLEESDAYVRVIFDDRILADTRAAKRVLETSHPPVYYIPARDVDDRYIRKEVQAGHCEWKGRWIFCSVEAGGRVQRNAGWYYPDPVAEYAALKDHFAFYAGKMDACYVDQERVIPQPGDFYGGWVTSRIVGPFKGAPGTFGW